MCCPSVVVIVVWFWCCARFNIISLYSSGVSWSVPIGLINDEFFEADVKTVCVLLSRIPLAKEWDWSVWSNQSMEFIFHVGFCFVQNLFFFGFIQRVFVSFVVWGLVDVIFDFDFVIYFVFMCCLWEIILDGILHVFNVLFFFSRNKNKKFPTKIAIHIK